MSHKVKPGITIPASAGLVGFDGQTIGGFGANRTTLVVGGHGTGKTVFALQTLVARARGGEPGIFVSFEESPSEIRAKALPFGWDLSELERRNLFMLHARVRPQLADKGRFALRTLLSDLAAAATRNGARLLAFDGLHVMITSLQKRDSLACDVIRLRDWITEHEFSVILTLHLASPTEACFMESLADCLVSLECAGSLKRPKRRLKVVKYRGEAPEEKSCRFRITDRGIEVSPLRRRGTKPTAIIPPPVAPAVSKLRKELSNRLRSADAYLEVKQAEMDYLLEKKGAPPANSADYAPPEKIEGRTPAGEGKPDH